MRTFGILLVVATCFLVTPLAAGISGVPGVNTLVITLKGDNLKGFLGFQTTINGLPVGGCVPTVPAAASPANPRTAEVTCNFGTECLTWQAQASSTGHAGGIVGEAWCGNPKAPLSPSIASLTPKDLGTATGPLVIGPSPPPENCLADWSIRNDGIGPWTVTCTFTFI